MADCCMLYTVCKFEQFVLTIIALQTGNGFLIPILVPFPFPLLLILISISINFPNQILVSY